MSRQSRRQRTPCLPTELTVFARADIYFYGFIIVDADLSLTDDCSFYGFQRLWGQH